MARLYRLFLLIIALVTVQHSLALAEDGPGKPNPIKARILKAADSTDLLLSRGPIEPLRSRLFLKDNKPTGPDPIRFIMQASKDSVALGEEFEITITAQLLDISPQSMFFFEEQKSYTLKLLLPEGFQQTGGTYYDYVSATLSKAGQQSATYTLKGRFSDQLSKATFTLLRGAGNASASDLYVKVANLTIANKLEVQPSSARVATTNSTVICPIDNVTFSLLLSRSQAGQRYIVVNSSSYNSVYEYSLNPPNYSLSNVLTPSVDSGTVFIRMKDRQVCMRRIDYSFPTVIPGGGPSAQGAPTNCDDFKNQDISIYPSAESICSPGSSLLSLVNLNPDLAPDKVEWYLGATKLDWSASEPARADITVYQEGYYHAKLYKNLCNFDSRTIHIGNNCPTNCTVSDTPSITATNTSLCPSGSTTLNAIGCVHATIWYKVTGNNIDYYLSEGNTYTTTEAGEYYAKCASVANCDECINYCEGTASGKIAVTSCQPTCNIAITGLTNGQILYTACNTGVTLTGDCSGSDCSGASATWSKEGGWSSSGRSVTTPAQTVNSTIAYKLTLTKGGCTKTITVYVSTTGCTTVNPCLTPNPPTLVQSETHCAGSFNLSVSGCSEFGYRWREGSATGQQVSTGFGYSPTLNNTTVYYVSCANSCDENDYKESSPLIVTATVDCGTPNPCANGLPNQPSSTQGDTQCSGNTFSLSANGCATGYRWYNANGDLVNSSSNYGTTLTTVGITTYYVSCINDCGESITRRPVSATVTNCPSTNCYGSNPDYRSAWDGGDCTSIYGWALDRNCPQSLILNVYIDNVFSTTIIANGYRYDVPPSPGVQRSHDYDYCGFNWTPVLNSGTHTVSIRLPNGVEIGAVTLTCGTSCNKPASPSSTQGQSKCSGSTFSLSASGCSSSYRWYTTTSGGSSLNSSSSYSPILSNVGITTYYVSCNDACGESITRTPVSATVLSCQVPCSVTPTITSQTVVSGTDVTWTLTASGCTSDQSVRWFRLNNGTYDPDRNPIVFVNPEAGAIVYAKCIGATCQSAESNMIAYTATTTCTTPGNPTSIHNDNQCITNIFSLSANCQTNSYRWYDASIGGNLKETASIYHPNPISTTTYYVSCSNACGESNRVAVTAIVRMVSGTPTPTITSSPTTLTANGCSQVRWFRADDNNFFTTEESTFDITNIPNGFQLYARCVQDGCPGPSSSTFTVGSDPCSGFSTTAPTLSARVAGTTSSQSLTLTASGCSTGGIVRWYGPNSTTAVGTIWMPSFSQTSDYAAVCETSNGCQSQPGQIHVTFKNPPAPQIQTTATQLCSGESVTLTATGCPTNVRWSTGQMGSPLVLTPSTTATYWAYCIDDEVVGNLPSTSIQVTVANSLTVNGRTDYTVGETISLTAISSVQGAIYTWYGPSGFSQTGQILQRLGAAVSQSGNYTVVATSNSGCAGKKIVPISVSASSFTCTCTDCDLIAVKETTNPDNPIGNARSRGSVGQNFVTESVYLEKNGGSVSQTISYFDGLGRPSQKVSVGTAGGSSAGDVIAPMVYDAYGREPQKYLPYVDGATPGTFRLAGAGAVQGYYAGLPGKSGTAFSTMTYEASPLNRVLTQTAPGSSTPVKISYRTNTAGEVKRLDVGTTTVSVATYDANQLYVTQTTDENQNTTIEYKDKEGRVVCKDVSGRKTLYGYDDLGQLRVVEPPLASSVLSGSFNLFDAGDELSFAYEYDARGRMTRKKVPGAGVSTMAYDNRDRLITTTDANGTVISTEYDNLDRVVATKQGGTLLSQTFYDSYGSEAKGFDGDHAYSVSAKTDNLKGMVTSTITGVLGTGTYLTSSTYYDDLGRAIQTISDNHKGGVDRSSSKLDFVGRVLESRLTTTNSSTTITVDSRTAYEQGGRVKSVCQKVSDNQQTPSSNTTLAYWEPVARHTYNGIGELTTKTLGCGIQTIDYQYQMRGWLSQMNDPANLNQGALPSQKDFFGMKLAYDGVGNITTWDYSNAQTTYSPYGLSQKPAYQYGFTYDNLNRLTSGTLNQQGQNKFTLNGLLYDDNGNITHLNRAMGTATDNLSYSYKNGGNSNQLASVSDGGSTDFAKSSGYDYDANGNLTKDSGKGISTPITYNYLNLPKKVVYSGGEVNYTYSASGQKLSASFPATSNSVAKSYDYVGGLVYANNQLEFIPTAEGRVLPPGLASTTVAIGGSTSIVASNSFYRYEYHLKDHLGNLRAACRCGERQTETTPGDGYEPLVVQEQHYDPFGLDLTILNSQPGLTVSRLKYLDRELQPDLGWYDLQARFYDPSTGRFTSVDPVTENQEEFSMYQYSYNNPITKSDPDGRCPKCPPGYTDPMQLLSQGFSQMVEAATIAIDRFSFATSHIIEKGFSANGNTSTLVNQTTTETSTNSHDVFTYIKNNNTNEGNSTPLISTKTTNETRVENKRETDIGVAKVSMKNSVSTGGKVTLETKAEMKASKLWTVSASSAFNTNGDRRVKLEGSTGLGSGKVKIFSQITDKLKSVASEIGFVFETENKSTKTKVTNSASVKYNSN